MNQAQENTRRVLVGYRMHGCPPLVIIDEDWWRERAAK